MTTHDENSAIIQEMLAEVKENRRTLRGYNGDAGLVAKVINIESALNTMMNNHLPHMQADLMNEIGLLRKDIERQLSSLNEEKFSVRTFMKKNLAPMTTNVLTSVVIAWILIQLALK
jgi:hypothetical protein